MIKYLEQKHYIYVEQGSNYNQYSSTPVCFKPNKENIEEFNAIYQLCIKNRLNSLIRTPSGAIAKVFKNNYSYDCRTSVAGAVLTIIIQGRLYVFKLGHWGLEKIKENDITPHKAFELFREECKANKIDLEDYAVKNGKEIKALIPKPKIIIFDKFFDKIINNVHHIDFHSSYPAGLVNTHPEFYPVVKKFYDGRKEHPTYKGVLNFTIGMMQSTNVKIINARYAQLSLDAISDNNKRIEDLSAKLYLNGNTIIGYNTDGIWYSGPIYHGTGEGEDLGQWSNDHTNCRFRAKSSGCYEFIENGKYNPVVRGLTTLDREKERDQWQWGDIYKSSIIDVEWKEGVGFEYSI